MGWLYHDTQSPAQRASGGLISSSPSGSGEPLVTQEPTRTLVEPTDADLRVTQEPTRAVLKPTDVDLRVTQGPAGTLVNPTDTDLRVTQAAVRVLAQASPFPPPPYPPQVGRAATTSRDAYRLLVPPPPDQGVVPPPPIAPALPPRFARPTTPASITPPPPDSPALLPPLPPQLGRAPRRPAADAYRLLASPTPPEPGTVLPPPLNSAAIDPLYTAITVAYGATTRGSPPEPAAAAPLVPATPARPSGASITPALVTHTPGDTGVVTPITPFAATTRAQARGPAHAPASITSPPPSGTPTPPPRTGAFFLGGICNCCAPCDCRVTICVTGCPDGTEVVGATVEISSDAFFGTCTTTDDGAGHTCCQFCVPTAGDYTLTVSATGFQTYSQLVHVDCDQTIDVELQQGETPCELQFTVLGCCLHALAGATVTVDGLTLTTAFDPGTGGTYAVWFPPGPGSYPVTISACRFQTTSFTVVIGDVCGCTEITSPDCDPSVCTTIGQAFVVQLTPDSGLVCGFNGAYPVPTTLHLTDSVWGSCTMTYDGVSSIVGSIGGLSYPAEDYGGGATCPPSPGFSITYKLGGGAGCPNVLHTSFTGNGCGSCPGGFFSWNTGVVPSDTPAPLPCAGASPTLGCPGSSPTNCLINVSWAFGNSSTTPGCTYEGEWDFILDPSAPTNPTTTNGIAVWTNFGPGSITVTE